MVAGSSPAGFAISLILVSFNMPSRPPRILTFNHHESFLCSLADTGWQFDVVVRYKKLDLAWNVASRPVPTNFRLVEFDDAVRRKLDAGEYDSVICHTLKNLLWLWRWRGNKFIFIAHIPLFRYTLPLWLKSAVKLALFKAFRWSHPTVFVAVSEFKRKSWKTRGHVAVLAPQQVGELSDGKGYDSVTVVCNDLMTRQEELGAKDLMAIGKKIPLRIIGRNPGAEGAIQPKDYCEFRDLFSSGRIYLYTIRQPFGDGYNTAMLEAMQMGMAVVTVDNPSSPIIHGENGLVARNPEEMLAHCQFLLSHPGEVDRLGSAARATVREKFSQGNFISAWQGALASL